MKKTCAFLFLCFVVSAFIFSDDTTGRGQYLSFGLGFPSISYGSDADKAITSMENLGADRTTVSISIDGGAAVSQKAYIVVGFLGMGDRYTYLNDLLFQFNTYKITIGTRLYPFITHLQLGFDAGIAKCVIDSPYKELEASSPFGPAGKLSIAYDIDSTPTGVSLLFGLAAGFAFIDGDEMSDGSIFMNLCFK